MKPERWVFGGLGLFYLVVTPVYWFTAHEVAGTWVLGLSAAMALMVFFYVQVIAKKINPRPSDEKDAEVIDGAGPVGFFPPQSIWPFWCALVVAIMCLGPIFGWWISLLGLGIAGPPRVGLLSTTAGITLTDRPSPPRIRPRRRCPCLG